MNQKKEQLELGIIGLGKIGGSLALNAIDHGIHVIGKDISRKPGLESKGVVIKTVYEEFASLLEPPRIIFLSLPAGEIIDAVLEDVVPFLDDGDVVLDGGNSFFMDSIRRERELRENHGIIFLDCGTSGGVTGARNGACFMVGGNPRGISLAKPILESLAVQGGFIHTGKPGSGHFVKLVHNGIEFCMLQAIGEGYALLKDSDFNLDMPAIFKNWSNGSVIRGWLIELMEQGLRNEDMGTVPSYIEDTGEVNWLLQHAINREVPIPAIMLSVMELFKSRKDQYEAYKAIALMRHGFGGHPFGSDTYISKERKTSRLTKL